MDVAYVAEDELAIFVVFTFVPATLQAVRISIEFGTSVVNRHFVFDSVCVSVVLTNHFQEFLVVRLTVH